MIVFLFPLILHSTLLFLEPTPILRRFPRLTFYLYLPCLLIILPYSLVLNWLLVISPAQAREFEERFVPWGRGIMAPILLYVISWLLVLITTYRRASQPGRRKLRVAMAGLIVGSVPWLCLMASLMFDLPLPINGTNLITLQWFDAGIYGVWLLTPASFAYAVVRHQVIPISLVIRRSLQYLFAKNALRLLLALPLIGLALTVYANRNRTLGDLLFRNSVWFYASLLAALADWLELGVQVLTKVAQTGEIFIIDSLPVPVCKRVRARRCRKVRGLDFCGYCAAKKEKFFGWRLHLICTP